MIVLISGKPASGKTTLAHAIGQRLSWPVLIRDDFKSGLSTTPSLEVSIRAFDLWFDALRLIAGGGSHVIGEAAMHRIPSTPNVAALRSVAPIVVVHCNALPATTFQRYVDRGQRHPVHDAADAVRRMQAPDFDWSIYDAVDVEGTPVLEVDTSDGYEPSIDAIVAWVEERVTC